jgi:hypothetical protein
MNKMDVSTMTLRELIDLRKEINSKISELQEIERENKKAAKLAALKALKPQAILYTRITGELFGRPLRKIRDGKKYMLVAGNGKQWRVSYDALQIEPLNDIELRLGRIIG